MKNKLRAKIYYKDTDAEGVVYYANYLGFLEMGRMELVEQLGISQKKLRSEKNLVFAVREVNCKYLAPAVLGDELEIETSISEVAGATIVFKQEILRISDRAKIISASVTAFAMDLKKMAPAKIPQELREKFPG
jgi:acyl-CoA thioester hydrolase